MRIIARLPAQAAQQVEYLTTATGHTVSHVVREAIALYHAQVRGARKGSGSRLLALAGTGDSGRADTAADHKALFAQYLDQKYPRTPSSAQEPAPAKRRAAKPRTTAGA